MQIQAKVFLLIYTPINIGIIMKNYKLNNTTHRLSMQDNKVITHNLNHRWILKLSKSLCRQNVYKRQSITNKAWNKITKIGKRISIIMEKI